MYETYELITIGAHVLLSVTSIFAIGYMLGSKDVTEPVAVTLPEMIITHSTMDMIEARTTMMLPTGHSQPLDSIKDRLSKDIGMFLKDYIKFSKYTEHNRSLYYDNEIHEASIFIGKNR